jgi:hypothetical protein
MATRSTQLVFEFDVPIKAIVEVVFCNREIRKYCSKDFRTFYIDHQVHLIARWSEEGSGVSIVLELFAALNRMTKMPAQNVPIIWDCDFF